MLKLFGPPYLGGSKKETRKLFFRSDFRSSKIPDHFKHILNSVFRNSMFTNLKASVFWIPNFFGQPTSLLVSIPIQNEIIRFFLGAKSDFWAKLCVMSPFFWLRPSIFGRGANSIGEEWRWINRMNELSSPPPPHFWAKPRAVRFHRGGAKTGLPQLWVWGYLLWSISPKNRGWIFLVWFMAQIERQS